MQRRQAIMIEHLKGEAMQFLKMPALTRTVVYPLLMILAVKESDVTRAMAVLSSNSNHPSQVNLRWNMEKGVFPRLLSSGLKRARRHDEDDPDADIYLDQLPKRLRERGVAFPGGHSFYERALKVEENQGRCRTTRGSCSGTSSGRGTWR